MENCVFVKPIILGFVTFLFVAFFVVCGAVSIANGTVPNLLPSSSCSSTLFMSIPKWLITIGGLFISAGGLLLIVYAVNILKDCFDAQSMFGEVINFISLYSFALCLLAIFIFSIVSAALLGQTPWQLCSGYSFNVAVAMTVLGFCLPLLFIITFIIAVNNLMN